MRLRTNIDGPSLQAEVLAREVLKIVRLTIPPYPWAQNLKRLIIDIQRGAKYWKSKKIYKPAKILAIPKKATAPNGKQRLLAVYSLRNSVLSSCFAAYIRDRIDPALYSNCLAFRSPRNGQSPPTHHDAIDKILCHRVSIGAKKNIWVTECDIQGFFDAVSHTAIRAEFKSFLSRHCIRLHSRALRFIDSFLAGYSFYTEAIPRALQDYHHRNLNSEQFADPREAVMRLQIQPSLKYGIPQGSAISCLLANIILSKADSGVQRFLRSGRIEAKSLYIRFCDDIVILAPTKNGCKAALRRYLKSLRTLRLPYHPPSQTSGYSRDFWALPLTKIDPLLLTKSEPPGVAGISAISSS